MCIASCGYSATSTAAGDGARAVVLQILPFQWGAAVPWLDSTLQALPHCWLSPGCKAGSNLREQICTWFAACKAFLAAASRTLAVLAVPFVKG